MTPLKTALEHILPAKGMKISRFDQLNDPFELKFGNMSDREDSMKMLTIYEVWCEKVGVVCMGRH